jgi:dCMP deaminase
MNRIEKDDMYMEITKVISQRSYCKRKKVGCIIVKDNMIISDGYNGTPTGFENICEDEENNTKAYVLHAEANALTKLAKSTQSSIGSTLYVTMSPCYECSKLIIQTGIKRVIFNEIYRVSDGLDLLRKSGIEVIHLNNT